MAGPWHPHTWPETAIGWPLCNRSEGQGSAHEAAVAVRDDARDAPGRERGWKPIVRFVDRDNARAIALADRLGCWHDTDAVGWDGDDLVCGHPLAEAA